ncbi:MAG TPA: ubiquinone/menaquinone biosynthesis methyltransferase [Tepidisphaeraceae bacterium]|jgi:demethylmenaquinone methyltransferase/2-methoxy-6-polyprenyl-1,4-benzoquinol methylase|nr:ubiquinone/menaquinone biosynthesis methyltransferase [Tepidisphaeraceae bacterium]
MIPNQTPTDAASSSTADSPAWDDRLLQNPHAVPDKRGRVQRMFAAIAPSYDLNNRVHSLWIDQAWRRKTVRLAKVLPADAVVDVACGTGDLTLKFAQAICDATNRGQSAGCRMLPPRDRVVGIDFTYEMLPLARAKAGSRAVKGLGDGFVLGDIMQFVCGDATALPLQNTSADIVSIAFGIRNIFDPAAAIREFFRVLRPGGRLLILEFSLPTNPALRALYNFYFRKILPRTATLISGDRTGAYKYLPESVNTFIGRAQMMQMMRDAGFTQVEQYPMTFGISVCYRGIKAFA